MSGLRARMSWRGWISVIGTTLWLVPAGHGQAQDRPEAGPECTDTRPDTPEPVEEDEANPAISPEATTPEACPPNDQQLLGALGRLGAAPGLTQEMERAETTPPASGLVTPGPSDPRALEPRGVRLRTTAGDQPVPLRWGLWQGAALLALEHGAAEPAALTRRRATRAASTPSATSQVERAPRPIPTAVTAPDPRAGRERDAVRFMRLSSAASPSGTERATPPTPDRAAPALREGPSDREVAEAVASQRSAFQRCYAMRTQGLTDPPRVAYRVRLRLNRRGEIRGIDLERRRGQVPRLGRCVRAVAAQLDLAGEYADRPTITFPLIFAPGN